jgi:UDP-glucuronate decarboxylase
MRFLVTGAAGFLGSNFALKLLKMGHDVVGIDNLSSGFRENLNLHTEEYAGKFEFYVEDTRKIQNSYNSLDGIFNFACIASPIKYQAASLDTLETNFIGTRNLLDIAYKNDIKIFHASTSEVYGDPSVSPQSESYFGNVNPFGYRACYDEGKRVAEALMFEYSNKLNVSIRVARIFNTYGPGMAMHDGRVISNFIVQSLTNEPITIYGNGNQTRSFCFVTDLLHGIWKLFESDITSPVNLGSPEEYAINEIKERILELIPESKSKTIYMELPYDDPVMRKPDITKAQRDLGWLPKVEIENGLSQTIEYFTQVMKKHLGEDR